MKPDLRALLFSIFSVTFIGIFAIGWAGTGSFFGGLIVFLRVIGLMVLIIILLAVFLWIGSKIFHD